jgi:hypothetical protein
MMTDVLPESESEEEDPQEEEHTAPFLECPNCGCRDLRVYYTRVYRNRRIRRRFCRHCGRQVTTTERITG